MTLRDPDPTKDEARSASGLTTRVVRRVPPFTPEASLFCGMKLRGRATTPTSLNTKHASPNHYAARSRWLP